MSDFVLVHGSCHGAWCWRDVVPRLAAAGHRAIALDLPAHGADPTPPAEASAGLYVDAILDAAPRPAILVGHSLGGMWITAAAERAAERVRHLVYVAAWVPDDGDSARDLRARWGGKTLRDAMVRTPDGHAATFRPELLASLFYGDCPPGTTEFAAAHLCPEPLAPMETPLSLGPRHARVPRSYVRCLNDAVIPPAAQKAMSAGWPAGRLHDMASGHSPFFSQPDKLAEILIATAEAT